MSKSLMDNFGEQLFSISFDPAYSAQLSNLLFAVLAAKGNSGGQCHEVVLCPSRNEKLLV